MAPREIGTLATSTAEQSRKPNLAGLSINSAPRTRFLRAPRQWLRETYPCTKYAHACRGNRALAEEMHDDEPKSIMLRTAADYEKLVEWAEEGSDPSP